MYKPTRHVEVPSTDLLSWVFGNGPSFDTDRPVNKPLLGALLEMD